MNIATIWYGPHACEVCGVSIIKAAREHGGAEFNYPVGLTIYPNHAWAPHVHLKLYQHQAVAPSVEPLGSK